MLRNPKQKGNRNEHKSIRRHAAAGAYCTRAGGSLGLFDFIALYSDRAVLVQVKSNRWPSPAETKALVQFVCPEYATKIIERWDDYVKEPLVRELP